MSVTWYFADDYLYTGVTLSNNDIISVVISGVTYKSVAHYYYAQKYNNYKDLVDQFPLILTPKIVSELAEGWPRRIDWQNVKLDIMRKAMRAKFEQHPIHLQFLKQFTEKNRILAKRPADLNDEFWCVNTDGAGSNHLGRILMEIRDTVWWSCHLSFSEMLEETKTMIMKISDFNKPENKLFLDGFEDFYEEKYVIESLNAERNLLHCSEVAKEIKRRNFRRALLKLTRHSGPVNLDTISALHTDILNGLDPSAGLLRSSDAKPSGSDRKYMPPHLIHSSLLTLLSDLKPSHDLNEALNVAASFLSSFLMIHPFRNGNGRLARLLLSHLLLKHTVVPVILFPSDKYIPCLEEAQTGFLYPLKRFVLENVFLSCKLMCDALDL